MGRTGKVLGGLALALLAASMLTACKPGGGGGAGKVTDQGWTLERQQDWYHATQGSRLIPWPWMQALEQPGAQAPFMDEGFLSNFRILPAGPGALVPLPVGFAIDEQPDDQFDKTKLRWKAGQTDGGQWLGLNCAACHTAEIAYNGTNLRIDGGPSLFQYQEFIEAFNKALEETKASAQPGADGARWDRFAKKVLGKDDTAANRALLLDAFGKLLDWETQTAALNHTDLRYGYGRVDAFGHIFNRILLFGGAPQPTPNASDAPVSYPHLWNIYKQTHLQWDGIATSNKIDASLNPFQKGVPFDFGALGRNTGEVLGVFGEVVIKPPAGPGDFNGFVSSANAINLNRMEDQLTHLTSPVWPAKLMGQPGAVDITGKDGKKLTPAEVLATGGALFQQMCASCHTPGGNPSTYEHMISFADLKVGGNLTDEWMACNAWDDKGASGKLTGVPANYVNGDKLPANSPVAALLETSVKGALVGKKIDMAKTAIQGFFGSAPPPKVNQPRLMMAFKSAKPITPKQARLARCMASNDPLLAYKARPLEGIWATGPFLHNGSVPTLYDLLQAPDKRPVKFNVGTRNFDAKKVGPDTNPTAPGNGFVFDTTIDGNSNKGHVYGVDTLSENDRLALLEYLKSL